MLNPVGIELPLFLWYASRMRTIGEVVAISIDGKPAVYGRIEGYEADRKPRWYQVSLLLLTFPPQVVIWTLREEQIDGEAFTMEGVPVRIQSVPTSTAGSESRNPAHTRGPKPAAVISLADRARKRREEDGER